MLEPDYEDCNSWKRGINLDKIIPWNIIAKTYGLSKEQIAPPRMTVTD